MDSLTETEKLEFLKYYLEYQKELETNPDWIKDRQAHIEHKELLEKYLSKDKIGNLTKNELIELLKTLWANNMWPDVDGRFIQNNNNDFELVRDEIAKLLYSEEDIANRINNFYEKIKYFGISNLSEMLNFSFPDKYPLWNGRAIENISKIAFYNIGFQHIQKSSLNINSKKGSDYQNVIDAIAEIKDYIAGKEGIELDFIQMDSIISSLTNSKSLLLFCIKRPSTFGHMLFAHRVFNNSMSSLFVRFPILSFERYFAKVSLCSICACLSCIQSGFVSNSFLYSR